MNVLLKTLLFTIIVPGGLTATIPYLLVRRGDLTLSELWSVRVPGVFLIFAGLAGYVWCVWNFAFVGHGTPAIWDPPQNLVSKGPYRSVRNPIYLAILVILGGEALLFCSLYFFLSATLVAVGFHLFVVHYEEPFLTHRFGPSYERYCREVPRWFPKELK